MMSYGVSDSIRMALIYRKVEEPPSLAVPSRPG